MKNVSLTLITYVAKYSLQKMSVLLINEWNIFQMKNKVNVVQNV